MERRGKYIRTETIKGKQRFSMKGKQCRLGKKLTEKSKDKIRQKHFGIFIGEKSPLWKGGWRKKDYYPGWTETLKRSIRERDNYICQLCSQYGDIVHHIDYNKHNHNPNNLITLCNPCHSKTNFDRQKWTNYFANIILISKS